MLITENKNLIVGWESYFGNTNSALYRAHLLKS